MAVIPVFHGMVTADGKLELAEAERDLRRLRLQQLAGNPVDVVVKVHRNQRSLDQNAYIHAVPVTMLAEHFGNEVDEMKLILMGECWGWKLDPIFGPRDSAQAAHVAYVDRGRRTFYRLGCPLGGHQPRVHRPITK